MTEKSPRLGAEGDIYPDEEGRVYQGQVKAAISSRPRCFRDISYMSLLPRQVPFTLEFTVSDRHYGMV